MRARLHEPGVALKERPCDPRARCEQCVPLSSDPIARGVGYLSWACPDTWELGAANRLWPPGLRISDEVGKIELDQVIKTDPPPRVQSADCLVDEHTGASWYEAWIALDTGSPALVDLKLQPGMPTEVMIVTGERTGLEYLLEPIVASVGRALREK